MPAIDTARPTDTERLFEVWESSVRATHHFLTEDDIAQLVPLVRGALAEFTPIHVLRDGEDQAYAFMGVHEGMIEMLFVHDAFRGRGAGAQLVRHAIAHLGARKVDVNEQNPQARGFYEHMGFAAYARLPLDGAGRPFPIVHMELKAG